MSFVKSSRGLSPEALANVFSSFGSDLTMRPPNEPDSDEIEAYADRSPIFRIPSNPKKPRAMKRKGKRTE